MPEEVGPVYNVPLIKTLPIGNGCMLQAMPSRKDLRSAINDHTRLVAAYEVLLSHYINLKNTLERIEHPHRRQQP
jgi:hypothetical protein